jgi:hypothetical protein
LKKIFIIGLGVMASLLSFVQNDTSTLEQYCEIITRRVFRNKLINDVNVGERISSSKGSEHASIKLCIGIIKRWYERIRLYLVYRNNVRPEPVGSEKTLFTKFPEKNENANANFA